MFSKLYLFAVLTPVAITAVGVGLIDLVVAHQLAFAIGTYYTVSIAVTSMNNPWDGWYNWFYRFSNGMCAVVQRKFTDHHLDVGELPAPVKITESRKLEVNTVLRGGSGSMNENPGKV